MLNYIWNPLYQHILALEKDNKLDILFLEASSGGPVLISVLKPWHKNFN